MIINRIPRNIINLQSGLVVHYKLNDNEANTTVINSAGTNGTASSNTSTLTTTGKINSAFDFNGNEYIDVVNESKIQISGDMTFCAWINWNSVGASHDTFIEKGTHDSNGVNYVFGWHTNENLKFTYSDGSFRNVEDTSGWTPSNSVWYHIIISVNTSDNKVYFYVDNTLKSSVTDTNNLNYPTNSEAGRIGLNTASGENFDGIIDDLRLYNEVLSASKRKQIYNNGIGTER